jgi:(p)ppGpp synthase/HD superfamily hydrolase
MGGSRTATQADLARAIAIAAAAHAEQLDKAGKPYIMHPVRVMQRCAEHGVAAQMVAVLHDVVEDTWVTMEVLRQMHFPDEVVDGVDAMTRRPDEAYFEYVHRCSRDPIAALVKLADLEDNSDPVRAFATNHDRRMERYAKAREIVLEAVGRR